jgi:hypothetical protein
MALPLNERLLQPDYCMPKIVVNDRAGHPAARRRRFSGDDPFGFSDFAQRQHSGCQ